MALTCGFTLTILKYKTIRLRFSIGIWTMHSYADDPEPTHKVIIPTSDIFWNYFSRLSNSSFGQFQTLFPGKLNS